MIQVLTVNKQPAVIPESDITNLRMLAEHPSLMKPEQATPNVQPEDYVEVIHGPLQGYKGQVTYLKDRTHVVIWIEAMRAGVSAEVKAADLMRVKRKAAA